MELNKLIKKDLKLKLNFDYNFLEDDQSLTFKILTIEKVEF